MPRLTKEQRKAQILQAAFDAAKEGKLYLSMRQIAVRAGCSRPLIKYHFGSMINLRTAVVEEAIRVENLDILACALLNKEPAAFKASQNLRDLAATKIASAS